MACSQAFFCACRPARRITAVPTIALWTPSPPANTPEARRGLRAPGRLRAGARLRRLFPRLVLYEQGQYAEAEPYFAQSLDILYGRERYQYCHAHVLAEEGRFAEAARRLKPSGTLRTHPFAASIAWGATPRQTPAMTRRSLPMRRPSPLMTPRTASTTCAGRSTTAPSPSSRRAITRPPSTCSCSWAITSAARIRRWSARPTCGTPSMTRPTRWRAAAICQGAYDLFSSLSGYRDAAQRAENLAAQLASNNLIFFPGG